MKITDLICFMISLGGAYFELDGREKVKDDAEADVFMGLLTKFCEAWRIGGLRVTAKNGNQTYTIPPDVCHGYIFEIIECTFKKVGLRDPEFGKYTVSHFRKLLL